MGLKISYLRPDSPVEEVGEDAGVARIAVEKVRSLSEQIDVVVPQDPEKELGLIIGLPGPSTDYGRYLAFYYAMGFYAGSLGKVGGFVLVQPERESERSALV